MIGNGNGGVYLMVFVLLAFLAVALVGLLIAQNLRFDATIESWPSPINVVVATPPVSPTQPPTPTPIPTPPPVQPTDLVLRVADHPDTLTGYAGADYQRGGFPFEALEFQFRGGEGGQVHVPACVHLEGYPNYRYALVYPSGQRDPVHIDTGGGPNVLGGFVLQKNDDADSTTSPPTPATDLVLTIGGNPYKLLVTALRQDCRGWANRVINVR